MKIIKKFLITAVAAMPVFLCSCPGDSCVDEHQPKGFVVKMKNDYSDKVSALMCINNQNDTSYYCAMRKNHTSQIVGNYYKLTLASYDDVVYTSIDISAWKDEMLDSLSKYVIDINPFEEVYAYYQNYDMVALKSIVENNSLNKLEKLK